MSVEKNVYLFVSDYSFEPRKINLSITSQIQILLDVNVLKLKLVASQFKDLYL